MTTTVPFIQGWGVQWYVYVPGWLKVRLQVSPIFRLPESNDPSSAVTVCTRDPAFVHVTLLPTETVIVCGSKSQASASG